MKTYVLFVLTWFAVLTVVQYLIHEVATAQSVVPASGKQLVHGWDLFTITEGRKLRVEIDPTSNLGRQVRLWQEPTAGSNCNIGRFGVAGEYLYVCRPLDGTDYGLWVRTKIETVW